MKTTLPIFLERNLVFNQKMICLGVLSNSSQVKEIGSAIDDLTTDTLVESTEFTNPNTQVDLQALDNRQPADQKKIWVIGIASDIFESQWTRILAQQKKMEAAAEYANLILILNIYDMKSVYDIIPSLKNITVVHFNCDVEN